MAHSTMNAEDWYTRERLRIEHLTYMTVPGASANSTEWYFRAKLPEDEQDIIANTAEDDEYDYEESVSDPDSDDSESAEEDMDVDEVAGLSEENAGLLVPETHATTAEESPNQSSPSLHPIPYVDMHPGTEKPEVAVNPPSLQSGEAAWLMSNSSP